MKHPFPAQAECRAAMDRRFGGIFARYFITCAAFLIAAFLLLNMLYSYRMTGNLNSEISRINETSMERSVGIFSSILQSMKQLAFSISSEKPVQLTSLKRPVNQSSADVTYIQELLDFSRINNSYIDSFYLYFEPSDSVLVSGGGVQTRSSMKDISWYDYYDECANTNSIITFSRLKDDFWPYCLTIMAPIRTGLDNGRGMVSGAVVVNVSVRQLSRYMGTGVWQHTDEPILLTFSTEDGQLLYSDELRLLTLPDEDFHTLRDLTLDDEYSSRIMSLWGQTHVISFGVTSDEKIAYCYLNSLSNYEAHLRQNNVFVYVSFGATLLLALVLSFLLARWAYRPIRNLLNLAKQGPLASAKYQQDNEIEAIKAYILETQGTYKKMRETIDEYALSLHNAQLNVLQSQIDPHFLYNTFEAIGDKMVMELGRENQCSDMLRILSRLLRLSLSTAAYLVPLREEIEHVRMYMQIMSFRCNGQILWSIDIPEKLMNATVVKLSLQPIIENSIMHGLRPKRYRGTLTLSAEETASGYLLYIRDNGVGIPADIMRNMNHRLATTNVQDYQHIGLYNVNQRIRLIFGTNSGVELAELPGGGTEVLLRYHIEKSEELPKIAPSI